MASDRMHAHRHASPNAITLSAFVLIAMIGGANAVAIKIGMRELDPFWGAAIRFLSASALLVLVMLALRRPWPRGRALKGVLIFGLLNIGLTYAFAYYALTQVTAGTVQVLLAMVPLVVVFLSALQHVEPLSGRAIAGALTAIAGTAIVFSQSVGSVSALALGALVAAVFCIGQAAVTIKRFPRVSPLVENAISLGVGGLILLAISGAAGENWAMPVGAATLGSLGYLILFGSMGMFWLYLFVIERWTASAASYSLVLMPVFTIIYAAILLGETVTGTFIFGGVVIFAGLFVGVFHRPHRPVTGPGAAGH